MNLFPPIMDVVASAVTSIMGTLPAWWTVTDWEREYDTAEWEEWFAWFPVDLLGESGPYYTFGKPVLRARIHGKWFYTTQQERALRRLTH